MSANQNFLKEIFGKCDNIEEAIRGQVDFYGNSKSFFRNWKTYDKNERKLNFGQYLDKYKNNIVPLLKDLYNKRQLHKNLENYVSDLQKYGKIFKVLQKSNLPIPIIYYKAKKIFNNINLEELIQSIEESLLSKSCR